VGACHAKPAEHFGCCTASLLEVSDQIADIKEEHGTTAYSALALHPTGKTECVLFVSFLCSGFVRMFCPTLSDF